MILKNLTNLLKFYTLVSLGETDSGQSYMPIPYPVVDTSGNALATISLMSSSYPNLAPLSGNSRYIYVRNSYSSASNNYINAVIGNGTTPVTEDDYCLESMITSGFSTSSNSNVMVKSISFDSTNNKIIKRCTIPIQVRNTGTTDLTISEIGLVHNGKTKDSSSYFALIHREVFDPITIAVGQSRTLTLDFEFVTQLA